MRLALALAAVLAALTASAAATASPSSPIRLTEIGRLPFPERGYLVDLPRDVAVTREQVRVEENGFAVESFTIEPLPSTRLRYGAILAVDASLSMRGAPFDAALAAARSFLAHRPPNELIGIVAFNGSLNVVESPTSSGERLRESLSDAPRLAYGTRIFDVVDRSLDLLEEAKISAGSIVVLSDGADVGSRLSLARVVAKARAQHVRVFTVGLRSRTFDGSVLKSIAAATGATYAEAASPKDLAPIYTALADRLAGAFVVQYHSRALPGSQVGLRIEVDGFGAAETTYTAPTPSALAPYHRSLVSRFLLSPFSLVLLSLAVAGLLGLTVRLLVGRGRPRLVERAGAFVSSGKGDAAAAADAPPPPPAGRPPRTRGPLARLERDLEIAEVRMSAPRVVALTLAATALAVLVLALLSPIVAVLGLLTPLATRGLVSRRLRQVRGEFAEQLPASLQVVASGLRAGHTLSGALAVAVEDSKDPLQREFRRIVADDRLGVPLEEAIRRVAHRMQSRDLEQVALVAELQRTTGGNAAEVLDTVVETIRERADFRRLVKTLTAQGRLGRWILTGLPVVTGLAFLLIQPELMRPVLASTGGQVALVVAALMVVAGSFVIQKIVEIEA